MKYPGFNPRDILALFEEKTEVDQQHGLDCEGNPVA